MELIDKCTNVTPIQRIKSPGPDGSFNQSAIWPVEHHIMSLHFYMRFIMWLIFHLHRDSSGEKLWALAGCAAVHPFATSPSFIHSKNMPLPKYYCDYCEREFHDTPSMRKKHFEMRSHKMQVKMHYDSYKGNFKIFFSLKYGFVIFFFYMYSFWPVFLYADAATIVQESIGKPLCNAFARTGFCEFGPRCRYSHVNPMLLRKSFHFPIITLFINIYYYYQRVSGTWTRKRCRDWCDRSEHYSSRDAAPLSAVSILMEGKLLPMEGVWSHVEVCVCWHDGCEQTADWRGRLRHHWNCAVGMKLVRAQSPCKAFASKQPHLQIQLPWLHAACAMQMSFRVRAWAYSWLRKPGSAYAMHHRPLLTRARCSFIAFS